MRANRPAEITKARLAENSGAYENRRASSTPRGASNRQNILILCNEVSLLDRDDLMADWLRRWLRRAVVALRARARSRRRACIRCGAPATVACRACGALACDRCWLPSIEAGDAAALCLDCIAPGSARRDPRSRSDPARLFRDGARMLGAIFVALLGLACWRRGWSGAGRIVAVLFEPAVLLGLVPMAFLLGALRSALIAALRALVTDRSRRAR